jgi:membrane associated rhomboid family serine protease
MGLPHGTLQVDESFVIVARADVADRARDEIIRYERENVGWPPREAVTQPISQGIHAAIVYAGVMVLVYILQHREMYGLDWTRLGRADAARIRAGEWWRAATALSLHADLPHVAGNVVFGAAFGVILAQSIGVGLAWWGFLLTGTLGNLLNAWLQSPEHSSIGASTAVFGALGLQTAFEWMRRRELHYAAWRRWVPLIMGVGLLAWLGTGGASIDDPKALDAAMEKVDVMAHVFGFAVGAVAGILLGLRKQPVRLEPLGQALLTISAFVALCAAWVLALGMQR